MGDLPRPTWGALIRKHREDLGWTLRELARNASLSDAWLSQMERQIQVRKGVATPFVASVGSLLHVARALRLTLAETDELVAAAGYTPMPAPRRDGTAQGPHIDVRGLDQDDVRLVQRLVTRLLESYEQEV